MLGVRVARNVRSKENYSHIVSLVKDKIYSNNKSTKTSPKKKTELTPAPRRKKSGMDSIENSPTNTSFILNSAFHVHVRAESEPRYQEYESGIFDCISIILF